MSNLYVSTVVSGEGVKVTPITGNSYYGGVVATTVLGGVTRCYNSMADAIAYCEAKPAAVLTAYVASEAEVEEQTVVVKEEQAEAWDELEKSVIASVADDVIVGVKGKQANITIVKKFA